MMDFFALVGGQHAGVYRMEIAQAIHSELERKFESASTSYTDAGLTVHQFRRENFNPDESEVLEIPQFDLPPALLAAAANPIGSQVLGASVGVVSDIYCIVAYESSTDTYAFQAIQAQQRIATSGLSIILSANVFRKLEDPGLLLSDNCHAVHVNGSLRFRSLWWLKRIFDISTYYQQATVADITNFTSNSAIKIEDGDHFDSHCGAWARSRIAYILDSGVLTSKTPLELQAIAATCKLDLEIVNDNGVDRILVPGNTQKLREVLKFLEEEYYPGVITGTDYETNSKRPRT